MAGIIMAAYQANTTTEQYDKQFHQKLPLT